jgi:hypothetical protein
LEKEKKYLDVRFSVEVLKEAVSAFLNFVEGKPSVNCSVQHPDATWDYDQVDEFYIDYRQFDRGAYLSIYTGTERLCASISTRSVAVSVRGKNKRDIEQVFDVFERNVARCKLPEVEIEWSRP